LEKSLEKDYQVWIVNHEASQSVDDLNVHGKLEHVESVVQIKENRIYMKTT